MQGRGRHGAREGPGQSDVMMARQARPPGRRCGHCANHTRPACQVGQELELHVDRTEAPPSDLGTGEGFLVKEAPSELSPEGWQGGVTGSRAAFAGPRGVESG